MINAPFTASSFRARRPLAGTRALPTPWVAWAVSLLAACLVARGIVYPKVGVGLAALVGCGGLGAWILARPMNGLLFALCLFPMYTALRGIAKMYGIPIPLTFVGMWPEMVATVCLAGIVVDAIRRRKSLRLGWDDTPVAVLVFVGLYGVAVSLARGMPIAAVYGVHYSLSAYTFYFVARWARPSRDDIRRVVTTLLVSYALLAVLSLIDYTLRPDWGIRLAMAVREGYWSQWEPYVFFRWYPRMQSLLFAEALWGTLSALVSLLCLALVPQTRRRGWIWLLFFVAIACLALSMSRGALGCWLGGTLVFLLVPGRHRLPTVAAYLALFFLVGAGLWVLQGDERVVSIVERTAALADTNNQLAYDRVWQWKHVVATFWLLPAGRGLGAAGTASFYHSGGSAETTIFDGGIFRILAEQGIPGVLCVAVAVAAMAFVLARLLRGARGLDRAVGLTALALLVGLSIQNIGQNAYDFPYVPYVLWMLAGLFVARRHRAVGAEIRSG